MERFHKGELEAQRRAGVEELARRVGRIIGTDIPSAVAAFLSSRAFLVVATEGGAGVHASLLEGDPGFVTVSDDHTLAINPARGDLETVRADVAGNGVLGLLAIDFPTRRRMRVNGLATVDRDRIVLTTREVYGNCPQYIDPRNQLHDAVTLTTTMSHALDERQQAWIASADTFFIASVNAERGADASHRGGEPGFVAVTPTSVSWPDYEGNNMFNTIGNLLLDPRCSLLFVEFQSGATLRVDGSAIVRWDGERRIAVEVETVVERRV